MFCLQLRSIDNVDMQMYWAWSESSTLAKNNFAFFYFLGLPQIVALHLTKTNCDFLSINVKSDGFPGIMDKKLNLIQLLDDSANMEINDTLKLVSSSFSF